MEIFFIINYEIWLKFMENWFVEDVGSLPLGVNC